MGWETLAVALLSAVEAPVLSTPVARAFVAPGAVFARDCRLLAVYLDTIEAAPLALGELPGGGCALMPVLNFRVVFVADCVPAPSEQGAPPPADDVTAWSETYLADVELVWNAIADAALDGSLGECDSVSILPSQHTGPIGGTASTIIPVRIAPLDGPSPSPT